MSEKPLSPEKISILIDHVLKTEDPATVGLRRILKQKRDAGTDFPYRPLEMPALGGNEGRKNLISKDDARILELEKQLADLRRQLTEQRRKSETAIQGAYRKGVEQGRAQGSEEGEKRAAQRYEQQLALVEERMASVLRDVARSQTELVLGCQTALLDIAVQMARKVVHTELKLNSEVILAVIRKTLAHVADRSGIVVRVSPDDLETVSGRKDFWTSVAERLNDIRIEADERIQPGGCIIESAAGVADARTDLMLDELRDLVDRTWHEVVDATLRDAAGTDQDGEPSLNTSDEGASGDAPTV